MTEIEAMPNGWSLNEPTMEWWYWREGEVAAKVAVEAWPAFRRSSDFFMVLGPKREGTDG